MSSDRSDENDKKWRIVGTKRTAIVDDDQTSTPKKKFVKKSRSKSTGHRIHVTCYTGNEFIAECCNDGTLKNVNVVETNEDTSRFQAILIDHDRSNEYMSSVTIELDWNHDAVSCKKELKNQYFVAREKLITLWKKHIQN